ncbi:hypothetical protein DDZ14_13325 [Maritimibacter sp. 55A14]|uniref:hypothetical protein n=1 Tax=Maritimibacter sp. 55A14 TaxID=2174844 RepID=UPI000D61F2D7|nr:hypothetical protein [Maritimibacter sp. 55A14]PWE31337.1 hypothetical protein DDZ14_13325 [Maritimibacter sp. 55A14]
MKPIAILPLLAAALALSACDIPKKNKTVDRFYDHGHLSQLKAGIWVDPRGCDHWIIDDGVEGYLSARLDHRGKPVCSGSAPPEMAVGPFKDGSGFPDPI